MNSKNTHSICKIIFLGLAIYLVVTNLFTSSIIEGQDNMDNTAGDNTVGDNTGIAESTREISDTAWKLKWSEKVRDCMNENNVIGQSVSEQNIIINECNGNTVDSIEEVPQNSNIIPWWMKRSTTSTTSTTTPSTVELTTPVTEDELEFAMQHIINPHEDPNFELTERQLTIMNKIHNSMSDKLETKIANTESSASNKNNLNYSIAPNQTGNPVRHMTGGVQYIPKNVMRVPDVVSGDVTSSSIAPNSEVLSNTVFHNGQYQSINSLETQPMLQTTPKYAY